MQRSGSRHRSAAIIVIVALAIVSASASFLSSDLVLVSGPQHPEIALDICRPLQVATTSTHLLLAFPRPSIPDFVPASQGQLVLPTIHRLLKGNVRPEIPPPKLYV